MLALGVEGALGLAAHLFEGAAAGRAHGGRHGALDERGRAQNHRAALLPAAREHLQRDVRAEEGAAQVHEQQHALRAAHALDRPQDPGGIGADRMLGIVDPRGRGGPHLGRNLRDELEHAPGERFAVRDQHQADHAFSPAYSTALRRACIRMSVLAAPGSRCPALRGPR